MSSNTTTNKEVDEVRISYLKDIKVKYEKALQYLNYEKISPGHLETIKLLQELKDEE